MKRAIAMALLLTTASGCATWRAERRSWELDTTSRIPTTVILSDAHPVQRLRIRVEVSEAARKPTPYRDRVWADVDLTGRWKLRGGSLPQRALLTSDLQHRDPPIFNSRASLHEMDPGTEPLDLRGSVTVEVAGADDECKPQAGTCSFVVVATFSWYGERRGEVLIEPEVRVGLHGDGRSRRRTAPPPGAAATIVESEVLPPLRGGVR